jgi:dTDP-4-dehydrorhamnose 3,5-epimerase
MTPEWDRVEERIEGVQTREVKNIVTGNGVTTELFRKDWGIASAEVTAMIYVTLRPGAVSAWHMHRLKTDHLFAVGGALRVVLWDDREDSSTRGRVDVLNLSPMRPMLVVIPPGVWHGVQVLGNEPGAFVNFFDREYDYEDPDDWRLPPDSTEVPYRF